MLIIGCDYHPSWQQICWMDTRTGETGERKLEHARERPSGITVPCLAQCGSGWSRRATASGSRNW